MPCFLVLLALVAPRITVAVLWFLSPAFRGVFDSLLLPLVGFILLPTTLLWYAAVQLWYGGVWSTVPVIGIIIALLIDLSPASGRRD